MKKIFLGILCVCFSFVLCACSNETQLRVAHIVDRTSARSTDYAIEVVLDDDDRVKEKYVDLQIKSKDAGQTLYFGEENKEKMPLLIEKKDYWYNLTYLLDKAKGLHEGGYQNYEDYGGKAYTFFTDDDAEISFRVVAGNRKMNGETNEEILVLSEDISKTLTIKTKKHE